MPLSCTCGEPLPSAANYRKCPACGTANPGYSLPRWPMMVGGIVAMALYFVLDTYFDGLARGRGAMPGIGLGLLQYVIAVIGFAITFVVCDRIADNT